MHPDDIAVRTHERYSTSNGSPVRLVRTDSARIRSRSSGCRMFTHSSGSARRCSAGYPVSRSYWGLMYSAVLCSSTASM